MKKLIAAFIIIQVLSINSYSKNIRHDNIKIKKIISVYDGDTFRADLNCEYKIFCENIGIRIYGIDTPEIKDKRDHIKKRAYDARDFVRDKLYNAKKIHLRNIKRGKYFRIVADVYADGQNIGDMLINNNMAYPYFGGTKQGFK